MLSNARTQLLWLFIDSKPLGNSQNMVKICPSCGNQSSKWKERHIESREEKRNQGFSVPLSEFKII